MKQISNILVIALLLFQFTLTTYAKPVLKQNASDSKSQFVEKIKKIESFVTAQMKRDGVTGLTIGFQKDGFRWVKAFGLADIENNLPTKNKSSYRMASVTKPMTAVGILTLVEQGKIDLDAEVQTYVPYFPKKKYPVTIRQLLGHLGGISHYRNYDLEGHFKNHKNTREAIKVFEDFDLINEPGTRYRYTSYGYNLLGAVIEGASGKSYGEYMTENVWKPLGMKNTIMDDPLKIVPNRVKGYRLVNGKLMNSEFIDISSRFAAGGIRSTVPDMLNFAKGMYEGKLLTEKMRSEMWTSQTAKNGYKIGYGYGWQTGSPNGRFMVSHSGSQAETKTYLMAIPNEKFAAAVAINFENVNPTTYPAEVFKILYDEPWAIRYYSNNEKDGIVLRGMDLSFAVGMKYFNHFGKPLTKNETELKDSFKYFKDILTSTPAEMDQKISSGINPVSKEPLVKMLSYMGGKLKQNGKDLDRYYKDGVIFMFNDYINWYKTQPNYSNDLKFDKSFEQKVSKWRVDWAKIWKKDTQNIEIYDIKDAKAIGKKLNKAFAGMSVYPNYINDLNGAVEGLATSGDMKTAFEIAQINYDLYPMSSTTNATMGTLHIFTGQNDKALDFMKKSLAINPRGNASANAINNMAYNLSNIGQPQAGLQLLLVGIKLHPKEANLYDSAGEFFLKLKQTEKGIELYKKALEVNPNYPNAKAAKDIVSKAKK